MGALYSAVLFIGVQNSQTVQPAVDVERTVFYREKAAGMYSPLPYAFAQVIKPTQIYILKQKKIQSLNLKLIDELIYRLQLKSPTHWPRH